MKCRSPLGAKMKFRYSMETTKEDDEQSKLVVEIEYDTIRAEGVWHLSNERTPDSQDWIFALERLAMSLANALQAAHADADRLAEALEQALAKIDKGPTAARGTIWDQELVDCMGQKVAAMNEKFSTKDEK